MSEKGRKKGRQGKARAAGGGRKTARRALGRLVTALAVAAAVFLGVVGYNQMWHDPTDGKSFHVMGGEMKPVLDPLQFGHPQIVAAYAAAQQFPDVMDQVYCYCGCDAAPFNHRSLLSCFTDYHGSSWGICQQEARRAAQLKAEGKTIEEIKIAIDSQFG